MDNVKLFDSEKLAESSIKINDPSPGRVLSPRRIANKQKHVKSPELT
jgi:hypothetical protein